MRKIRKTRRNKCILVYASVLAIALISACVMSLPFLVFAHEADDKPLYKYYKSIEIQYGDTLWNIAEETMTAEYNNTAEYVEVLMDMNDLDSDYIQAGQHLIIAYNDSDVIK